MDRNPNRNPEGSGPEPRATWRSYVAEAPAWLIVFGALAVSFWTQVFAVNGRHFAFWEALIWGASTDAGTIAFLFLAREGIYKGTATWGAWLGSVACAVMSVQWNVIPAWEAHDYLGVESHLWMPALALGTWYWLLHGRRRKAHSREPQPTPEPDPEPPAPRPQLPFHEEKANGMRVLLATPSGRALSDWQLGACLGIGADYAGRLRREIERAPEPERDPEPPSQLPPPPPAAPPLPVSPGPEAEPHPGAEPTGRERVTLARARQAYRKLAAKGPFSGAALGRELGVSDVMGRNWKRKVEAETKPSARSFRLQGVAA